MLKETRTQDQTSRKALTRRMSLHAIYHNVQLLTHLFVYCLSSLEDYNLSAAKTLSLLMSHVSTQCLIWDLAWSRPQALCWLLWPSVGPASSIPT